MFKVYFGVTPSSLREIKIKNFTLTISNIPFEKAQIKEVSHGHSQSLKYTFCKGIKYID
jgi:hypothetical protein